MWLIPRPSLWMRRRGYETTTYLALSPVPLFHGGLDKGTCLPGFHGRICTCACSGYQALFCTREWAWVQPHIYHSNTQVEKQWRDTLNEAELNLTSMLIRHYSSVIKAKKATLESIKKEITDYLKQQTPREEAIKSWNQISKQAEDEARKLSESLKESRTNRLHCKRPWSESIAPTRQRQQLMQNPAPERHQQQPHPTNIIQALHGFLNDYAKNEEQRQVQRGKGPAHGRGYPKKGGPPGQH